MFSLLSPKKHSVLGIDIGTSMVKLLELEPANGRGGMGWKLAAFAILPIPAGAMDGKRIADQLAVADVLRRAVIQSGSKTRHVASAVSAGTVINRQVQVPVGLSDTEMLAMIELEVSQHIPYPIDEVRYDFEVLGPVKDNPEFVDVLLVASRGDVVDDLTTTLELAELIPTIVDVDSYAINLALNSCSDDKPQGCVAVADIGAANMDLHVMRGDRLLYSREYSYGGEILTKDLMASTQLSQDEVEQLKRNDAVRDANQQALFDSFVTGLVQEIRGALQIYRSTSNSEKVMHLYLTGGCARLEGLLYALNEVLEYDVTILEPFESVQMDKHVHAQRLFANAPAMAVALGLALRRFD